MQIHTKLTQEAQDMDQLWDILGRMQDLLEQERSLQRKMSVLATLFEVPDSSEAPGQHPVGTSTVQKAPTVNKSSKHILYCLSKRESGIADINQWYTCSTCSQLP